MATTPAVARRNTLRKVCGFCIKTPRKGSDLVGCRLLDVVNDEDVTRTLGRFQFEPELFLQRRENRCRQTIREAGDRWIRRRIRRSRCALLWPPLKIHVEGASEAGPILHG